MMPFYQEKEENQTMNRKIMHMAAERDKALLERDRALAEKKAAFDERDIARQQRDTAMADRETAIRERDNALTALHFHENITWNSNKHRTNRTHCQNLAPPPSEPNKPKRKKANPTPKKPSKTDLNKQITASDEPKAEMNVMNYDILRVPIPVCTCTGEPHQCYKWGNMGWQSSCCTNTLSLYPLPQLLNIRHSRISGRKMSGTVFSRLLTSLAEEGLDISSQPLDLKNYWGKHGTNRFK